MSEHKDNSENRQRTIELAHWFYSGAPLLNQYILEMLIKPIIIIIIFNREVNDSYLFHAHPIRINFYIKVE